MREQGKIRPFAGTPWRVFGLVPLLFAAVQGCGAGDYKPERADSVTGEFEMMVADYPDNTMTISYFLNTEGGERYQLVFDEIPSASARSVLDVKGSFEESAEGTRLVVDSFDV